MFALVLCSLFLAVLPVGGQDLIVELGVGKVQGTRALINNETEVEEWRSIPFAEPPIGEHRFEKTVPVKAWSGVKNTTAVPPACAPIDPTDPPVVYSEDCLYLNVFRPLGTSATDGLPVLFVIHGGAFEVGSATGYVVADARAANLIENGVVLVTIQYRLAVFGFASSGDEQLPGNFGYWDQLEALKFVSRNIHAFGGDPKKITVLGHSAGGASVTGLSISPKSRDLFAQGIAMSGSVFSAWATNDVVVENTQKLARALGWRPDESLKQCLKRATMANVYVALKMIGTTHFGLNFGTFIPRLDGDFFPADFPQLIAEAPPKPLLIGSTLEESLSWTLISSRNRSTSLFTLSDDQIETFSRTDVERFVRDYLITKEDYEDQAEEVQEKILAFYLLLEAKHETKDKTFYLQKYTQIFSDLQFNMPLMIEIQRRTQNKWPVFVYLSSYVNPQCIPARCPFVESYHASDQDYLHCDSGLHLNGTDDSAIESLAQETILAFIKTGDPSTASFAWKPTDGSSSVQYANLQPKGPQIADGYFADRWAFWSKVIDDYDYDLIRMRPKNGATSRKLSTLSGVLFLFVFLFN